jgi:plasmid stabilization system protein ParE
MYVENLRGQLRFLAKHRGPAEAERARRLLLVGVRLRAIFFPPGRREDYREAARWLASGHANTLLDAPR